MRHLLDTNIVSEVVRPRPNPAIIEWVATEALADLFIAALTLGEIQRGILELPAGRRRTALDVWFAGPEGPRRLFRDRVLPFEAGAALEWARLMAEGRGVGRPRSPLDMVIAATAVINDCTVVTVNERHFAGVVDYFNPLNAAS